jgi:5-methylcytosine-specific restriction endonuclease McrA
MAHVTFFKPPKGQHLVETGKRKALRMREKNAAAMREKRKARQAMQVLRRQCFQRDKGRCRACGVLVAYEHPSVEAQMQLHHVIYLSAGGPRLQLSNVCTLCWHCHRAEHEHRIAITGNANETLDIVQTNLDTGRVLAAWESKA